MKLTIELHICVFHEKNYENCFFFLYLKTLTIMVLLGCGLLASLEEVLFALTLNQKKPHAWT
jgi:hypothetical protein